jgi:hypothetical protein
MAALVCYRPGSRSRLFYRIGVGGVRFSV